MAMKVLSIADGCLGLWYNDHSYMATRTIAAGTFKAHCLALMDEVKAKRQTLIITKRGEPVAKLVPIDAEPDDIFGFFRGKGTIEGDVVSPILSKKDWGNLG